jgi:spore germination protein
MQGNLFTTLLALIFYLTSGLFGGNSNQNQPIVSPNPPSINQGNFLPRSGVVSIKLAGIRDQYSGSGKVIVTVPQGSRLLILEEKNDYYRVQTDNGQEGWVAKWMISTRASAPAVGGGKKVIAGYYVENYYNDPVGYQALSNNLGSINMVIPFSFKVNQYGTIESTHNPKPMALAQSIGATTLALVNNIQGDNFNSNAIHRVLSNSVTRSKAITGITRLLVEKGYQGVNIDFENVQARDRIYLTAFFRELATALRAKNLLVTASVPAKTYNDRSSIHSGAFDYQAIAPYLDEVMIMTYDEHYSGGPAGPVASYPWVERVIKYSLTCFPAYKIVVGIAGYGYDWSWGTGKALNYKAIQNLIQKNKITPKWQPDDKVPYFSYKSWGITHQVWYENRYSTALKADLVKKYGLKGVAVWRLGYEDPGIWSSIQQRLL